MRRSIPLLCLFAKYEATAGILVNYSFKSEKDQE